MLISFQSSFRVLAFMLGVMILPGCQTILGPSDEEQRDVQILTTQKSMIINFLNKGLAGLALKELKTYLKSHPNDPDFKNLMGLTQLALKNPKQAIEYFRAAYKLEPRVPFALNIASAHIESGEYRQALDMLHRATKHEDYEDYQHPERVEHNLGLAYERTNRLKLAIKHYEAALANNPNFYISLMRLGHIHLNQKKYNQARQMYRRAKATCNQCFDPVNAIAMSLISQNQPQKAIVALQRYMNSRNVSKADSDKANEMIQMAQKFQKTQKGQF